jgi:hypothetical protein
VTRESAIVQKVGVVRDDDAVVSPSLGEHILVTVPDETNVADVPRVEALTTKNLRDLLSHAFVYKETHSSPIFSVHPMHFICTW